jgi:small subunit ribosomal protein S18
MFFVKKKNFFFNKERKALINWKSIDLLQKYTTRFWFIKPRKYTAVPVKEQKALRVAIIRARELGLIPYVR